jgi:predicted MFS family arabinose efflux permease
MMSDLLSHFSITASSFGLLTAFYYFAYAPMQVPVGLSVDRIGVRRSLLMASIISTSGVFIFSIAPSYSIALMGRFMLGFGAAFAYVTALKIAAEWLPKKYFATATGMVTSFGMISAIFTDTYLTHVVSVDGYVRAMQFPVFAGAVLILLIILFVRDKKSDIESSRTRTVPSSREIFQHLGKIVRNPQMWIIGVIGAFLYLPASMFLDVWGIPYLQNVYHLSAQDAAYGISTMLTGWICSSLATGAFSDLLGTRKIPLVIATFGSATVCAFILYMPGLPIAALFLLLFFLGVMCGPHPLCFTLSKENCVNQVSGTAVSFANFVIMMGGFIFQPVVGRLLDLGWNGGMDGGHRIYSAHDFTLALSILPICLLIAGLLTLGIRETFKNARDCE